MDTLLGKLTSLGYEVFGVIVPGLIFSVFLALWWVALGPIVPRWTSSRVPELTLTEVKQTIDGVSGGRTTASIIIALMICYFLGHAVNWTSKARSRSTGGWHARCRRVWGFLSFRVRPPEASYDQKLQRLFQAVNVKWTHDGSALSWREFYPLAKNVVANSGRHSLISTYQNKYTLHRSIAAAAAFLFWLTAFSSLGAIVAVYRGASERPDWWLLFGLGIGSILLVTGFSASYWYAWTLWGDTVIAESYALAFSPRIEASNGTR